MATKKIIIIPGSCSSPLNWFDQFKTFTKHNFEIEYMHLDAYKYPSLSACSINLFEKLSNILRDENTTILAHSMGGMLLLKILSEPQFYKNIDPITFARIQHSRIFFIQVPLKVNQGLLLGLKFWGPILAPILFVYRYTLYLPFYYLILFLKEIIHPIPVLNWFFGLFLNKASMLNSFWGSRVKEFLHLVNYYKQWEDFSLRGFFEEEQRNNFEVAINNLAENKTLAFDFIAVQEYFFTIGEPDVFCDIHTTKFFVGRISANLLELKYGFHNPQHFFWTQKILYEKILDYNS